MNLLIEEIWLSINLKWLILRHLIDSTEGNRNKFLWLSLKGQRLTLELMFRTFMQDMLTLLRMCWLKIKGCLPSSWWENSQKE